MKFGSFFPQRFPVLFERNENKWEEERVSKNKTGRKDDLPDGGDILYKRKEKAQVSVRGVNSTTLFTI